MADEFRTCPYCGRSYKLSSGFHGYCGKKCAAEDKGKDWADKKSRGDRRATIIFAIVIIIGAIYLKATGKL